MGGVDYKNARNTKIQLITPAVIGTTTATLCGMSWLGLLNNYYKV